MPSTLNGFGTTYSRRLNEHASPAKCSFCGRESRLASFDTSLAIAVLFVPVVKLKRLRVIDFCAECTRHRTIPHATWRTAVDDVVRQTAAALAPRETSSPADAIAACHELAAVAADAASFRALASTIKARAGDDRKALHALGRAYLRFDMPLEAIATLEAALAASGTGVDDAELLVSDDLGATNAAGAAGGTDLASAARLAEATTRSSAEAAPSSSASARQDIKDDLAWAHALMLEPAKAERYVEDVWTDARRDGLAVAVLVAEVYQQLGRHTDALKLLNRLARAFPDVAQTNWFKPLLDDSAKEAARAAPRPTWRRRVLTLSYPQAKSAVPRPSRQMTKRDKLVFAACAVACVGGYAIASVSVAAQRPAFVVNGSDMKYDVAIDNRARFSVAAGAWVEVTALGEGTHRVRAFAGDTPLGDETTFRMATSFLSRPFDHVVFFVNPDRAAVIVREQATYASSPSSTLDEGYSWDVATGDVFTEMHADFVFEPFPRTVSVNRGEHVVKTRVSLANDPEYALSKARGDASVAPYLRARLAFDPKDGMAAYRLAQRADAGADDAARFRAHLADRPTLVESWRAFLELRERLHLDVSDDDLLALTRKGPDACADYVASLIDDGAAEDADLARATERGCPDALLDSAHRALLADAGGAGLAQADALFANVQLPRDRPSLHGPFRDIAFATAHVDRWIAIVRGEEGPGSVDEVSDTVRAAYARGDDDEASKLARVFKKSAVDKLAQAGDAERENVAAEKAAIDHALSVEAAYAHADRDALRGLLASDDDERKLELALVDGDFTTANDHAPDTALLVAAGAARAHKDDVFAAAMADVAAGQPVLAHLLSGPPPKVADVRGALTSTMLARRAFALLAERFPKRAEYAAEAKRLTWDQTPPRLFIATRRDVR